MGGEKGRGGREEKERGAYRDEGPLTKILNTPLVAVELSAIKHCLKVLFDNLYRLNAADFLQMFVFKIKYRFLCGQCNVHY